LSRNRRITETWDQPHRAGQQHFSPFDRNSQAQRHAPQRILHLHQQEAHLVVSRARGFITKTSAVEIQRVRELLRLARV
jgi:hypothetical protein